MINLLPPQYKKELLTEENWKLTLILGILVLIFLLSLVLILFAIKIQVAGQVEVQKILVNLEEKEFSHLKDLEEKLNSINQTLSKLDSFYQGQFRLTEFLERIPEIIPEGIYLTSLSYQKVPAQVSLTGFSPTIGSLFNFKNNLEEQEDFKEVTFPTAIWAKLVDINFTVTFKIK